MPTKGPPPRTRRRSTVRPRYLAMPTKTRMGLLDMRYAVDQALVERFAGNGHEVPSEDTAARDLAERAVEPRGDRQPRDARDQGAQRRAAGDRMGRRGAGRGGVRSADPVDRGGRRRAASTPVGVAAFCFGARRRRRARSGGAAHASVAERTLSGPRLPGRGRSWIRVRVAPSGSGRGASRLTATISAALDSAIPSGLRARSSPAGLWILALIAGLS